jgi:hypothetical protein
MPATCGRAKWLLAHFSDFTREGIHVRSILAVLLVSLLSGVSAYADSDPIVPFACINNPPQLKTIRIKNNDATATIYPVLVSSIYDKNKQAADLWMQAECGIKTKDSFNRLFPTTKVRRAYINISTAMNNPAKNDPGIDETTQGVPPGATVTITVPFYTKISSNITDQNLGIDNDQFIDWWNSMRLVVLYGKAALYSAFWEAGLLGQPEYSVLPPPGIAGALAPSCAVDIPGKPGVQCTINFENYTTQILDNVPFQLQEYTFASATGPRPGGSEPDGSPFTIEKKWVNYNVSSLDSVYLPAAIGPILKNGQNPCGDPAPPPPTGCKTTYVGDTASVTAFNTSVAKFSNSNNDGNTGKDWPSFVPIYFAGPSYGVTEGFAPGQFPAKILTTPPGQPCSLGVKPNNYQPFPNAVPALTNPPTPYLLPKLPGTFNALIFEYNDVYTGNTQLPPNITGQPTDLDTFANYSKGRCDGVGIPQTADPLTSTPGLGTKGKAFVQLWKDCTAGTKHNQWCDRIVFLNQFFLDNWNQRTNCQQQTNDLQSTLAAVYGFVPITAPLWTTPAGQPAPCLGNIALKDTASPSFPTKGGYFNAAITKYCELQYNYLFADVQADQSLVFNPYVRFVHGNAQTGVPDGLGSTAYAFSIDDAVAFRRLVSDGIIITLAGASGLDDPNPTPPPTLSNFRTYCRPPDQAVAKVNTHDFNADSKSDVLWYNTSNGQVLTWLMNGASVIGGGSPGSAMSPWAIVGQRDFNGDGFPDLLWRNGSTGQLLVWLLNGTSVIGGGSPGSAASPFIVAGTGDFNGDGLGDVLWYNATTGQVVLWFLNGASILGGGSPGTVPPPWTVAGTGDFNGDRFTDILWYNPSTGQVVLWLLNGATVLPASGSPGMAAAPWTVAGTGDFNGDGNSDILWYNTNNGQALVWLLNGTTLLPGSGSPGSVGSPWTVVQTGDFNGDQKSDILWSNPSSGQLVVWLLNGASLIGGGSPGGAASPWQIQGMNSN